MNDIDTQESYKKTAEVMNRIFVAPRPIFLILSILFLSILSGFLIGFDKNDLYNSIVINGIFIFAIPAYLSALLSKYVSKSFGGNFNIRRSLLLSLFCLGIVIFIVFIGKFALILFSLVSITIIVIFSYATILWIRHIVFLSIVVSTHFRAITLSLTQPLLGILFLYFIYPYQMKELFFLISSFFVFFLFSFIFIKMVNAPMKKNFGENGLKLLNYFFAHMTENKNIDEIEKFFSSFSSTFDVPLSIIGFKTKQKMKAILVLPSIHPGPFGNLGGGNLPTKIAEGLKDISPNILVPHGATNHDSNLAVSEDCDKVIAETKYLINNLNYSSTCTNFLRCHDKLDMCAQTFGNSLLLIHTSAPNPTDDIDPAVEEMIIDEMNKMGIHEIMFIDAHNCLEKGAGCVFVNTAKANKILELSKRAANLSLKEKKSTYKIGYAQKTGFDVREDEIGPQGIQVITVETSGKKNSYILFDGNNMVKGLREKLINEIKTLVDDSEVLTTDNHIVNVKIGGYNPIGIKIDHNKLIRQVYDLVQESINDLEECNIGVKSGTIPNVKLFGQGNTYRLSKTINFILNRLKIYTCSTIFFAVILCIIIYITIY